jgi:hypothetical protein
MRNQEPDRCPPDLIEMVELLERERPMATPLELDQVKTRIMARRQTPRRYGLKGSLLKTRLAITMMLALGILTSGTGVGLAVSGGSSSGSAGAAQYPQSTPDTGGGGTLGSEDQAPADQAPADQAPAAQEANQVVATTSSGSLPFTGLAAIPILVVGVGLLATGLVVRRSVRRSEQA